jgi:hypothetical protein
MLKSSRELVKFPGNNCSRSVEVCMLDNWYFAIVFSSATGGGNTSNLDVITTVVVCCCESLIVSTGSFFLFFWLCTSLMSRLIQDIMLLQRLGVSGIILVLIYSLYQKKVGNWDVCCSSLLRLSLEVGSGQRVLWFVLVVSKGL